MTGSPRGGEGAMRSLFVFTPTESKRLIAKAVAQLAEVKKALQEDRILIGHGSTNVYIAEEILGRERIAELWKRDTYLSGVVLRGTLCTTLGQEKPPLLVLNRGVVESPALTMAEILRDFGRHSLFIKGANAVDPEGNAGVFVAHPEGGTIGWALGNLLARGIRLIVPVGLEKLVPSVKKAVHLCGQQSLDYSQGLRVGMVPLAGATVITEVEALKILSGVEAHHVASGGCSGSEGSVTLVAEGEQDSIAKALQVTASLKGEAPLMPRKAVCMNCTPSSPAQPKGYKFEGPMRRCDFERKSEEELPPYLRNR